MLRLSDATLKCLLSSCPELEGLTLVEIGSPTYIQLSNPKLKYSYIDTLVCCMIPHPPLVFNGFRCLTSLYFKDVTLSNETLRCLLSSCPDLEELTLLEIEDLTYIQLRNPKLNYLDIGGNLFIVARVEDLKSLVSATFRPSKIVVPDLFEDCNFGHVLGFLLGIEELCLGNYFLQSLPFLDVPRRLPSTYHRLKSIYITLNAVDRKEILGAISLFNSSPNLQELIISLQHKKEFAVFPSVDLQEVKDHFESSFNRHLVVTIYSFVGKEVDMVITKCILANSPVLERMKIIPGVSGTKKVLTFSKELLRFKRASPEAEIELGP